MIQTPTAEQFYLLSKASSRHKDLFTELLRSVFDGVQHGKVTEPEIVALAALSAGVHREATKTSLKGGSLCALEWLESQPAFYLAMQAVGLSRGDYPYWQSEFECLIRDWSARESKYYYPPHIYLRRHDYSYLEYVSGLAGAAFGYMTGRSAKAALNSTATVEKIKSRLTEIEDLLAGNLLPEGLSRAVSSSLQIQAAVRILESESSLIAPVISRRNDTDLPARLMASEIIWLHRTMFGDAKIRAVFQLMGLPFIARPLEMRTIERLAVTVKEQSGLRYKLRLEQIRSERAHAPAEREPVAATENDGVSTIY